MTCKRHAKVTLQKFIVRVTNLCSWLPVSAHICRDLDTHKCTYTYMCDFVRFLSWLKTLTKYLPEDLTYNLPSLIVSQAPPAVRVQVVHPIGGLDLSDPGWLGLLSQCPGPAWARDWGDEDQDLRPEERDTEREGNLPAFLSDWKVDDNFVGVNIEAGNKTNASHLQSINRPSQETLYPSKSHNVFGRLFDYERSKRNSLRTDNSERNQRVQWNLDGNSLSVLLPLLLSWV